MVLYTIFMPFAQRPRFSVLGNLVVVRSWVFQLKNKDINYSGVVWFKWLTVCIGAIGNAGHRNAFRSVCGRRECWESLAREHSWMTHVSDVSVRNWENVKRPAKDQLQGTDVIFGYTRSSPSRYGSTIDHRPPVARACPSPLWVSPLPALSQPTVPKTKKKIWS